MFRQHHRLKYLSSHVLIFQGCPIPKKRFFILIFKFCKFSLLHPKICLLISPNSYLLSNTLVISDCLTFFQIYLYFRVSNPLNWNWLTFKYNFPRKATPVNTSSIKGLTYSDGFGALIPIGIPIPSLSIWSGSFTVSEIYGSFDFLLRGIWCICCRRSPEGFYRLGFGLNR